ncbi:MAG: tRNA uridine-5-carboxymethylaminomethyl(34) synthesis GTPase MnmE [Elusimicrobia bacterium]|nr:tRNA uridine-5-carboxymethylaminomethyl(34) synthesis GTPase MnmE [Elusimicrobiota bacterium]
MATKNIHDDTIAAISTPPAGEGGIGIVRLSGGSSLSIADKIFQIKHTVDSQPSQDTHNAQNQEFSPETCSSPERPSGFLSHTIHYGWIVENTNGSSSVIDEVLLTVMHAPRTYTREHIVEINCHGGQGVLKKILELCLKHGARIAEPGEFTKRAFMNGRIDLSQAEAVCDLIRARTDKAAAIAASRIKGRLSQKIKDTRNKLLNLTADMEVSLDYSEEDIQFSTPQDTLNSIRSIRTDLQELVEASQKANVYTDGIRVSIIGRPNVGKSSLLNSILSEDRSIVTSEPGTTRDVVSETFNLNGIPVTIMDTAGIRSHYSSRLEYLSSERTQSAIEKSDIVLFVMDASQGASEEDELVTKLINAANTEKVILVLNKTDIKPVTKSGGDIFKKISREISADCTVQCSALSGKGITELENAIYKISTCPAAETSNPPRGCVSTGGSPDISSSSIIANARQVQSLVKAAKQLEEALSALHNKHAPEFVVIYVRSAIDCLGEIIGETTTEEMLDLIFSKFCVGK